MPIQGKRLVSQRDTSINKPIFETSKGAKGAKGEKKEKKIRQYKGATTAEDFNIS